MVLVLVIIVVKNADLATSGVKVEDIMKGHVMRLRRREMRPSASSQMTRIFAVTTYSGKLRIVTGTMKMVQ